MDTTTPAPAVPTAGPAPITPAAPKPVDLKTLTPQQLTQKAAQFVTQSRAQGASDEDSINFLKSKGIMVGQNGIATYQDPVEAQAMAQQAATAQQAGAKQPSLVGGLIRDAIRPVARGLLSLNDAGNQARSDITGQPAQQGAAQTPFTQYLEAGTNKPLERIGANFDPAQGFTPQNMAAIQDAVKSGVDVAGLFAGGGAAEDLATGAGEQTIKDMAIHGAKVGGTLGAASGASTALTPGTSVGDVAKNTVEGAFEGGATGAIAEPLIGSATKAIKGEGTPQFQSSESSPSADEFNDKATQAQKIINPDNITRQEDINKLSDVDAAGQVNSMDKGKIPGFKSKVLRPEVLAQDPHNQMVQELMDKGVVSPKNHQIDNIGGVKGEIQNEGSGLRRFLNEPHNDVPVPHADLESNLNDALDKLRKDNDIEEGSSEDKKAQAIKETFLNEISKEYKKQPLDEETPAGTASATKRGIENFNKKMEAKFTKDSIYGDTPEGRAQVKMAQLARKTGYDTIQKALNDFDESSIKNNSFGKDAKGLAERAKTFSSRKGFIDQMMKEGSNTQAEATMHAKEGTANEGTAASDVSKAGINVNPRPENAGYTTTPEEDLGEIYDMAHEGINSTKGNAFKASLQRQAKLYALRDEMMSRTNTNTSHSAASKFLNSPKGYAMRRIARNLGTVGSLGFGLGELGTR